MALSRSPTALVLRALGLGDLLAAVPALRAIRRAAPDHRLVLAGPTRFEPLVRPTGAVDVLFPAAGLEPLEWDGPRPDLAVNLHGRGPQSHLQLARTEPARMVAFGRQDLGIDGPVWRPDEHEVLRWCRLLRESLGIVADPSDLRLPPPPEPPAVEGAVVVHPGAAFPARRWPAGRFAEVARGLSRRGCPVVVTGTPDEGGLAATVCRGAGLPPVANLAGRTDLAELARLVANARLVVSGDTGVAHLAVAYGIPSVTLFGPTSPRLWGALSGPHVGLWFGNRAGDPHADRPDPALLRIPTDLVVESAIRQLESAR